MLFTDKISGFKEERSRSDASSVKKPKIVNNQSINFKTSNTSNGINCLQPNTNDSSAKINRKSKLSEAGTTSPNKDRLTTIFLDMENTSPKAQMFQKFVKNTESVSNVSQNGLLSNSVDFGKKSESAVINCTTEPKTSLINETNSNVTSLGTYSFAAIESINKTKDSQSSGAVSKFVVSSTKTDNVITVNSSPKTNSSSQFKFEAPAKTNIKVNISEKSSATNWTRENPSVATPITLTVNKISETENKITSMSPVTDDFRSCNANAATDSNQTTLQSYAHVTSENSELKTVDFGTFKFGSNGNLSSRISSPEAESEMKKEVSLTTDLKNGTTIKFSNTHNLATPQLGSEANNSGFSGPEVTSNNNSTQITSPININTNFVFGKTLLTNQEVNSVSTNSKNSQEKTEVSKNGFTFNKDLSTAPISTVMTNNTANNTSSNKISNDSYNKQNNCNVNSGSEMSSSILGQTSQSPPFVFGQKQACVETLKSNENNAFDSGQNRVQNLSQPKDDCQKENSESLKNVFKTSEPPVSTAIFPTSNSISDHSSPLSQSIKSITTTAQTKGNSLFTNSLFGSNALGQKSPILSGGEPKASDSPFNQSKNPQSLAFTFGQKSTDQNSNQSVSSETNESGQNNQAKLFSFGQTPSTQPSTSIKAFSPGSTESTMFGQNLLKVDSQQTANSSPFVQNISQAAAVSQNNQVPTFTPSTAAESTNNLENKSGAVSFGSIPTTAIFGQNTSTFASKGTSFFPSTTASLSGFGASSIQSNTKFGGSTFQTNSGFGVPTTTQSTVQFGTPATTQVTINFGASTAFINTTAGPVTSTFGASATTQPTTVFGLNSSSQLSSFGQPFAPDKATPTTYGISSNNIFESSNITPSSTSTAGFNSSTTTNNFSAPAGQSIFGSKTSTNQDDIFRQAAKIQAPAFGNNSTQGYGTQNKFSFGISTSNVPGFTTSPPKATSSGVFTFGATTSTPGSASSFGSGGTTTGSSSIRTPFSFNTQNNNAFKFGTSTTKENSVFDSSNANTLTFGTQMNNNNTLDAKPATPAFNFGSPQMPSTATFNFGSAPTPVFSFGTSGSTSSSSTFSFNTPQPGGVVFGQGTPSPAPSFSVPGKCILVKSNLLFCKSACRVAFNNDFFCRNFQHWVRQHAIQA